MMGAVIVMRFTAQPGAVHALARFVEGLGPAE